MKYLIPFLFSISLLAQDITVTHLPSSYTLNGIAYNSIPSAGRGIDWHGIGSQTEEWLEFNDNGDLARGTTTITANTAGISSPNPEIVRIINTSNIVGQASTQQSEIIFYSLSKRFDFSGFNHTGTLVIQLGLNYRELDVANSPFLPATYIDLNSDGTIDYSLSYPNEQFSIEIPFTPNLNSITIHNVNHIVTAPSINNPYSPYVLQNQVIEFYPDSGPVTHLQSNCSLLSYYGRIFSTGKSQFRYYKNPYTQPGADLNVRAIAFAPLPSPVTLPNSGLIPCVKYITEWDHFDILGTDPLEIFELNIPNNIGTYYLQCFTFQHSGQVDASDLFQLN